MSRVEKVVFGSLVALVVAFIGGIGYFVIDEIWSEKFYLRKDQFTCTASHTEVTTTFIQSGSTTMPVTNTYQVCDQWTRK